MPKECAEHAGNYCLPNQSMQWLRVSVKTNFSANKNGNNFTFRKASFSSESIACFSGIGVSSSGLLSKGHQAAGKGPMKGQKDG